MSETLIGTIIGAILAGGAMILNAYFSTKFNEEREDRAQKRTQQEKDIQDLSSFYEDVLHSLDKLIRNQGRGSESELEIFYKYEIRMKLISTDAIVKKFRSLKIAIGDLVGKLTPYPEEFIPKFEDDDHKTRTG